MQIFYYPFSNETNQYNERIKSILGKTESVSSVNPFNLKSFGSWGKIKPLFSNQNVVILNWLEYLPGHGNFRVFGLSFTGCLKTFIYIFLLCIIRARIIWVFHDRHVHDSRGLLRFFSDSFRKFLEKRASLAFCHSREFYSYVPHPLYRPKVESNEFGGAEDVITFLGAIQPYKQLHKIMHLFNNSRFTLKIYGRCNDDGYVRSLHTMAKQCDSVKINIGFVDESSIESIIQDSKVILIPHADDSAIVSGNIFLALTYNRAILARRTKFLESLANDIDAIYLFDDEQTMKSCIDRLETQLEQVDMEHREHVINSLFSDDVISTRFQGLLNESNNLYSNT